MLYRKYKNHKICDGDLVFDSKREYNRWKELELMEKAGLITDLRRQVVFQLIPKQQRTTPMKNKRKVELPVDYIADFVYVSDGKTVVEDTKGYATEKYIIKRKLMLERYGIEVQEI